MDLTLKKMLNVRQSASESFLGHPLVLVLTQSTAKDGSNLGQRTKHGYVVSKQTNQRWRH